MIAIDTSALIRLFTLDDTIKAQQVKDLLLSDKKVLIPDVVLPELEYVLSMQFDFNRQQVLEVYGHLSQIEHIVFSGAHVQKAIRYYETSNLDMADCLIAAQASTGIASFDKKLVGLSQTPSVF